MTPPAFRPTVARLLPSALVLVLAAAAVALGSQRPLTHPVTASAEALPATVVLDADATTLPFNAAGMVPGATAGPHELTVANHEGTPRRYALTSTTTEDTLAAQLDLWVWLEADEDDTDALGRAADNHTCDATPGAGITTYLYEQGAVGSTATTTLVGDPTQPHPDDRVLTTSDEVLCFYVELPASTANAYQGLTTTATFTIHADQAPAH